MQLNKKDLIESIKQLNEKKPLKEAENVQRVLAPADADAVEQHEEALKQNKERRDPQNYDTPVKELVEDTASEESRYSHFDVVDRKDLAKKINEAKEKKLPFKITRSTKEGFRYDFSVLKEEYLKKDAGDPEVNQNAFNNATSFNNGESGENGLCEEVTELDKYKQFSNDLIKYIYEQGEIGGDEELGNLRYFLNYLSHNGPEFIDSLLNKVKEEEKEEDEEIEDEDRFPIEEDEEDDLDEELKIYTSSLDNFHPSERAEGLWGEIKDNKKIEDLEYALETLYPDGISDEALDDMLIYEGDWIRDLIGLNDKEEEDDENEEAEEEEPVDEFDTDDDVEPIEEEKPEEKKEEDEPLEEKIPAPASKPLKITPDEKDEGYVIVEDDEDDNITSKLAEQFVASQFKPNVEDATDMKSDVEEENMKEDSEDSEEIVNIDDDTISNMMGAPAAEKK